MSSSSFPKLREHAPSGRAVVTVRTANGGRRDIYCGAFGSSESKIEYRRICSLLLENGCRYPANGETLTVAEAILKFVRHATGYYGGGSGLSHVKRTLKTVRVHFGHSPIVDFGPKSLKACQSKWVTEGITRKSINKMTGTVKRAWRWMVAEELIPADCFQRLQAVEGLRKGRTAATDNPPVKPAVLADVEAALPFLPPLAAAVVRLQVLSGARCGELLVMKPADIDRTGDVWTFTPAAHKGTWRGKSRLIPFGPEAQRLLAPFLLRAGDGFVFNPTRGEDERNAGRSAERKTPRYPSHMRRNATKRKPDRERPPGERYTTATLRRAVERACDAAGVPRFTPHRLRHLAAHVIREKFGLEHCRATLGHTVAAMSAHYSGEVDKRLASEVARAVG